MASSVSSSSSRSSLPEDLIFEILKRLRAKSLLRCMSVCKLWSSLITSPLFISAHHVHHQSPAVAVYHGGEGTSQFLAIHHDDQDKGIRRFDLEHNIWPCIQVYHTVGYSRGVICFARIDRPYEVILWNPSLRKTLMLTLYDTVYTYLTAPHRHNSSWDPPQDGFAYGLGCDSDCKLKLVSFYYTLNFQQPSGLCLTQVMGVYVYSLELGVWNKVSMIAPVVTALGIEVPPRRGVNLNGVLHWLITKRDRLKVLYIDRQVPVSIWTFNLVDQTFTDNPFPNSHMFTHNVVHSFEPHVELMEITRTSGERLGLLIGNSIAYRLWVMEEFGVMDSWTLVLTLNLDPSLDVHRIVSLPRDDQFVVERNCLRPKSALLNPLTMKTEPLPPHVVVVRDFVGNYVESLILIGHKSTRPQQRRASVVPFVNS